MPRTSKTDEFSEKFQTAFDPPSLIFGKLYCNFFKLKPEKTPLYQFHGQIALLKGPNFAI